VALQLAKAAGRPPRESPSCSPSGCARSAGVEAVEIAGPGFLNFRLDAGAAGELARAVVAAGAAYGRTDTLAGKNLNLEFVSANPTGPLHLGHTRWAAVGDALGRILTAAGAKVTREFYINDAGNQMEKFGRSLMLRANGQDVPEGLYEGVYVQHLADQIVAADPEILKLPEEEQVNAFRKAGYALQLRLQQESLEKFRTHFDVWFPELTLHESGEVERVADRLRDKGHVFEKDGATWLRTTDFGDDKDRVIVRSNGERTYFAADCAYYLDKRDRASRRASTCSARTTTATSGAQGPRACAGDDPERDIRRPHRPVREDDQKRRGGQAVQAHRQHDHPRTT